MKSFTDLHLPRTASLACLLAIGLWGGTQAKADTFGWTTWSSVTPSNDGTNTPGSATGSIGGVTVTYSGQLSALEGPSWMPAGTYTGGIVGNGPASGTGIMNEGGQSYTQTITFSSAVVDPSIALWSLGGNNGTVALMLFNGSEPFTIVAGGPSSELGGSSIYQTSNGGSGVLGNEGNGTIVFNGTFTSISFTQPTYESWDEFTVGYDQTLTNTPPPTAVTPEPSSMVLLGTGVIATAGALRRRFTNL